MHTTNQSQNNIKGNVRDAAIQITLNSTPITAETIDGTTFYSTERRGVIYTTYETIDGSWWVGTHRKSLGRHVGGGRYYVSLSDLANGCKAFAALPVFLTMKGE